MTTIEGGMISTNDYKIYNILRMLRSHGMVREIDDIKMQKSFFRKYPKLNKDFIFSYPAYNVRNTEIGGILGLSQLNRLNQNIKKRYDNFDFFLKELDSSKFYTNFNLNGSSNYAFILIQKIKNIEKFTKLTKRLSKNNIEYRVGTAGGGNQLRQPYLKDIVKKYNLNDFKNVEHVHKYSLYIGNFPSLSFNKIKLICKIINSDK